MHSRTSLTALALVCLASTARAEDTLIINPDSMHPGLRLVVVPANATALAAARDAGLPTGYTPWGGTLPRAPRETHAGLEPSPFHDARRIDLIDPDELLGISGIPVMLDGDGAVGIMPYVRGLAVETAAAGAPSANPTPYPDPAPNWLPELVAWPDISGWRVASVADGGDHELVGVAPAHWTIGGVDVEGIGVLIDGNGGPGALLGVPVLRDATGTTRAAGLHLVHL